jgi:hypothetical protein
MRKFDCKSANWYFVVFLHPPTWSLIVWTCQMICRRLTLLRCQKILFKSQNVMHIRDSLRDNEIHKKIKLQFHVLRKVTTFVFSNTTKESRKKNFFDPWNLMLSLTSFTFSFIVETKPVVETKEEVQASISWRKTLEGEKKKFLFFRFSLWWTSYNCIKILLKLDGVW